MKKYLSVNNNASCNSQTLHILRSVVDELYEINNHEYSLSTESKEKRVHFTAKRETESIKNCFEEKKQTIKYQPVLSDSTTVVCCVIKGRSKVDCSVSTNDIPSYQCECATQTTDNTVFSDCSYSIISLLTNSNDQLSTDLHRSKSIINPTTSLYSTTNHSLYSYGNTSLIPSLNTAHQLIVPSEVKHNEICPEQVLQNYNSDLLSKSNNQLLDENIPETDIKLCTCSKRKLSDNDFSNQDKLLEELHISKRSLQSMHDDGLFYIHDLVLVFLKHISHFDQILLKRYYFSKKQVNLFAQIINKLWKKR